MKVILKQFTEYLHKNIYITENFLNKLFLFMNFIKFLLFNGVYSNEFEKVDNWSAFLSLTLQYVFKITKSIPKDIKRALSDIVLFNGIGQENFFNMLKESPASVFDKKNLF